MIKLNFYGDFVANDISQCTVADALIKKIEASDYNIVNFEAPIQTASLPSLKSGPSIQQGVKAPLWLEKHGFNVFTLANNHILDFGELAAEMSVEALGTNRVTGIGIGTNAYKPLILEKSGLKVAILSLAELQFGMIHDFWTQENDYGCAWINHPCVNSIIRETRKKVDFLIIVAHAGLEGVDVPLPEWRDRYRELVDVGADVVIGGHTHTAQGYELYHGKPIFYSLGNFCFQDNLTGKESWNIGEVVSLQIDEGGVLSSFEVQGTKLVDGKVLSLIDSREWNEKRKCLNGLLEENRYIEIVNDICQNAMNDYNALFSMGGYIHPGKNVLKSILRYLLGRCKDVHMLNNIQCESHRWTISRALRLKNNLK